MTTLVEVRPEDLESTEVNPDDGEEDGEGNCEEQIVDNVESFGNLFKNLLLGPGREGGPRVQRSLGELKTPVVKDGKLYGQDFEALRQDCLASGNLFVDPEFPPDDRSLYFSQGTPAGVEWKRPVHLVENPALIEGGASRFDIKQGELGDCWLLAGLVNLTMNKKLLYQVVPRDQSFSEDYAGIFHFRFWQYGDWVDVVIDDFLPTRFGKLIFMQSQSNHEFWTALVEKAYAKLHGSYEALKGGTTCEAMVDFTGGITELYQLRDRDVPKDLFNIMVKAYERKSLKGCSLEPDPNVLEARTPVGLVRGHAYSITKVVQVRIETPTVSGKIPMLRIRNPWGNETEWNGAWSDGSPEWRYIPDDEKDAIGLNFEQDGEFWMSYKDFRRYFDQLEICNLTPEALDEDDTCPRWQVGTFKGQWLRGVSAGGCRNNLATFAQNPQYFITVEDPDENDDSNLCTVIVALMQKNRRALMEQGLETLTIGYAVYYLRNPESLSRPLDTDFFRYNRAIGRSKAFINLREVSTRFKLPPGNYCIVPSTFHANEEGEFILRIFSEKPAQCSE